MEITRIVNKRRMLIFFIASVLQLICFCSACCADWEMLKDDQVDEMYGYLAYQNNISDVLDNVETCKRLQIFQSNFFSKKNIEKTEADYKKMQNVQFGSLQEVSRVDTSFSWSGLKWILLLGELVIVILFLDGRDDSVRELIYGTPRGRGSYVVRSMLAILGWTVILVSITYGVDFFVTIICNTGNDRFRLLSYPIQALEHFKNCKWIWSIGQYGFNYGVYLCIFYGVIGMLVWLLLYSIPYNAISGMFVILVASCEVIMQRMIEGNSKWASFREVNFFTGWKDDAIWSSYGNINVFGMAVGKAEVNVLVLFVLFLLLLICGYWYGRCHYPGRSWCMRRRKDHKIKLWESMSFVQYELYKLLIGQKIGVLCIVIGYVILLSVNFSGVTRSSAQVMYCDFINEYQGPMTETTARNIQERMDELDDLDKRYEEQTRLFEGGELTDEEYSAILWEEEASRSKRICLEFINYQTEYLKKVQENNIDGWYVNYLSYQHLLQEKNKVILLIIYLFSGMAAFLCVHQEQQCNFVELMNTTCNRKKIKRKKAFAVFVVTMTWYLFFEGVNLLAVRYVYGLSGVEAPIQSLVQLMEFPIHMKIWEYFLCKFLIEEVLLGMIVWSVMKITWEVEKKDEVRNKRLK